LVILYGLLEDRCIIIDVTVNFFTYVLYKMCSCNLCLSRLHVAMHLVIIIDQRRCQNLVWTSVTHFPLFCSYYIFTSSVMFYWTDKWQHWMLNGIGSSGWKSITTNSPTQDSFHLDNQIPSKYVIPGPKPFSF